MTKRTIRALFLDGIELALWETAKECADMLEFDDEKLRRSWMNEAGNADDLEGARRKLIAKIDGTRGADPAPIIPPIRQLYVEGLRQKLWTMRTECAEAVGLSADTLRKYMDRQQTDCAGPREVTQFTEMQAALRKKFRPQKKTTAVDPQPKNVEHDPPAAASPSAPHWSDEFLEQVTVRVAARLQQVQGVAGTQAGPSVTSDWIDQVLAGHRELVGQSTPDCRFVIATAETIVPIVKGLTADERSDTAKLIAVLTVGVIELRRRLTLSAQTAGTKDREADLQVLGAELDLLVVGIEQAGDVNLGASAALRQAQRTELRSLRTALTGERNSKP